MLRGIDLHREFRERRWQRLLDLIDALPRDSCFIDAMTGDEELARQVAAGSVWHNDPDSAARVLRREWSPLLEAMAATRDMTAEVVKAVVAVNGGTVPAIPSYPRPYYPSERLTKEARKAQHKRLLAEMVTFQNP